MAKSNPRKQITEGKLVIRDIMRENLATIAENMIAQIKAKLSRVTDSQRLTAINDIAFTGQADYKDHLLTALAVVASDALSNVRKEVPKAKNVKLAEIEDSLKLGEFDDLPPAVRAKILKQQQLIVTTQMNDLQKAIFFQFNHSVDSTDSLDTITGDLEEAAQDYVTGAAIEAGAATIVAQVVNETRNEFFSDPEVQDELDAFEFMNGDPVSPICQDLAGTVFDKNDPNRFRYTPPLHFNCKSYIAPVLSGKLGDREISKLKPSTQKLEDTIQFSEQLCGCGEIHFSSAKTDIDPVN